MADRAPGSSHRVRFRPSKRFLKILRDIKSRDDVDEFLQKRVAEVISKDDVLVPFDLIKSVHEHLNATSMGDDGKVYLHELVSGCDLDLPKPYIPARDPELEARVQRLRAQQANREYAAMTSNVNFTRKALTSDMGLQVRQASGQYFALINVLVTVGGAFAFFYKAVEYSLPEPHIVAQVLSGFVAALVVAVAELYFFVKII